MIKALISGFCICVAPAVITQRAEAAPANLSAEQSAFIEIIGAACQISARGVKDLVFQQVITPELADSFYGPMVEAGVAQLDGDQNLLITPDYCNREDGALAHELAQFATVFALYNCTIAGEGDNAANFEAVEAQFAEIGISMDRVGYLATVLLATGRAEDVRAVDGLKVLSPLCEAGGAE